MKVENTKAQMRKGILELCILQLLHRRSAYANEIISALKEQELIVVEGTLYPLLTRLKNDGLLEYRWEESNAGPPRKYYSITEAGCAAQQELQKTWQQLAQAVKATQQNPKPS